MPSGRPTMTVRQGCVRVTPTAHRHNETAPLSPPPQDGTTNTDFRNGNVVQFRRSCSDLRPPGGIESKRALMSTSCDLRLGSCDVSLSTGDIILGTGEILRNNGEIWKVNTNQRTLSCQSLRNHTTLRRSRSGCVRATTDSKHSLKGTKDSKHPTKGTRETRQNKIDTAHNNTNKQGRSRGRQEVLWNMNRHKNLKNRTESGSSSSSSINSPVSKRRSSSSGDNSSSSRRSAKVSRGGERKPRIPRPIPHIKPVRVVILSNSDDEDDDNDDDCCSNSQSKEQDHMMLDDESTKATDTASDDAVSGQGDEVDKLDDTLTLTDSVTDSECLCGSSSSLTLSSIDTRPTSVTTTSLSSSSNLDNANHDSTSISRTWPRMRRSQSDFLKGNRKVRRASISIEDGNVKVIMHNGSMTQSLASFRADYPCQKGNGRGGSRSDAADTRITASDGKLVQSVDDNVPGKTDDDDDDDAPASGVDVHPQSDPQSGLNVTSSASTSTAEEYIDPLSLPDVPKWKQRPHPLIPLQDQLEHPWWEEDLSDSDDEDEQFIPDSRRNDREEIRRKLAMGVEEDYYGGERMYKKPNLQTRLQSGMNLQICFMNEATCDVDSVNGDDPASCKTTLPPHDDNATPLTPKTTQGEIIPTKPTQDLTDEKNPVEGQRPTVVVDPVTGEVRPAGPRGKEEDEDFFAKQAKLQDEARMALAQVRPMAHMQLEVEKQMRKKSPIAEMVGIPALGAKKKFGRHLLSDMNVAQLQVVVNDLHSQIETLNEELVMMLVGRDDLHMEQDSMLVDIEDHHRRALEVAARVNKPKRTNKKK